MERLYSHHTTTTTTTTTTTGPNGKDSDSGNVYENSGVLVENKRHTSHTSFNYQPLTVHNDYSVHLPEGTNIPPGINFGSNNVNNFWGTNLSPEAKAQEQTARALRQGKEGGKKAKTQKAWN